MPKERKFLKTEAESWDGDTMWSSSPVKTVMRILKLKRTEGARG